MQNCGYILSRIEKGIGYIELNRPDCLNAFNLDLAEEFIRVINAFRIDSDVRVVIIRGAGKVFSAGGDIKEMLGYVTDGNDRAAYFRSPLAAFGRMVMSVRNIPKPVLIVVHGAVAGAAFNLMLACDLIIAEDETRFTQSFIKLGLSPDAGGTWHLPRLVGYARACELTMLPTELDARTALEWGLINWALPADKLEEKVSEIAQKLVNGPEEALGKTKLLLNQAFDRTLEEHIESERLVQVENAANDDFEEGLRAFLERREPEFN